MSGAKLVKRASDVDMDSIRRKHSRSISGGIPRSEELANSASSARAAAEVVEEVEEETSFSEYLVEEVLSKIRNRYGTVYASFAEHVGVHN